MEDTPGHAGPGEFRFGILGFCLHNAHQKSHVSDGESAPLHAVVWKTQLPDSGRHTWVPALFLLKTSGPLS